MDRVADLKVDLIKMHYDGPPDGISVETGNAIIDQAHRRGLRAAAHIFYLQEAKDALAGGVDIIAHSVRDRDVDQAFIAEMRRRDVGYVPTLTRELSVFVYESTPAFFTDPFFQRGISVYGEQVPGLSNPAAQEKVRTDKTAQSIKQALVQANENLKTLQDAGITIAMGTDTGTALNPGRWQGYFEHVELEMMVKAGLTPMQALVAVNRQRRERGEARSRRHDRRRARPPTCSCSTRTRSRTSRTRGGSAPSGSPAAASRRPVRTEAGSGQPAVSSSTPNGLGAATRLS